jgi:hypothetical protein
VLDSVGISFANFMQWLMDVQMKTNYDGIIFMLRTIFVGHNADGTSDTVQTETIPMHLNRMEINLDFAKGAYTLEFMPNMNFDVNRYSRFLTISTATSYSTGSGNTLEGLINSFEKELTDKSASYFDSIQKIVTEAGRAGGRFGRQVKYQITIPARWKPWKVVGSNVGGKSEQTFTRQNPASTASPAKTEAEGQIKNSYTSVETGTTITAALDKILRQVPEVADLGNFSTNQVANGSVTFFKYIVGITSTDADMTVHVDIVEFVVPNVSAKDQSPNTVKQNDKAFYKEINGQRVPLDVITYDYIFTGKNKDVLNFEMKIQDFQFLLASNLRIGDGAMNQVSATSNLEATTATGKKENDPVFARPYDPLVMPLDTSAALSNFTQYANIGKSKELIEK